MGKKSRRNRQRRKTPATGDLVSPVAAPELAAASASEPKPEQLGLRAAANRCREKFVLLTESFDLETEKGKWNPERVVELGSYCDQMFNLIDYKGDDALSYEDLGITEDRKFIKKLAESPTELLHVRARAYGLWARICLSVREYDNAAQLFLQAVDFSEQAIECYLSGDTTSRKYCHYGWLRRILEDFLENSQQWVQHLRSMAIIKFKTDGAPQRHIEALGGNLCAVCGKTYLELGVKMLDCCTSCQLTFYCSRECQTKDWEEHKLVCRKRGEFRLGDGAYCIDSRDTLIFLKNEALVRIIGEKRACDDWFYENGKDNPNPENPDMFLVAFAWDEETKAFPVHRDRLRRVRPEIWGAVPSKRALQEEFAYDETAKKWVASN